MQFTEHEENTTTLSMDTLSSGSLYRVGYLYEGLFVPPRNQSTHKQFVEHVENTREVITERGRETGDSIGQSLYRFSIYMVVYTSPPNLGVTEWPGWTGRIGGIQRGMYPGGLLFPAEVGWAGPSAGGEYLQRVECLYQGMSISAATS